MFYVFYRFLRKAPVPFLNSATIGSIVDCALVACSLDHRDANASVMKFFYDLLHSGRNIEVLLKNLYFNLSRCEWIIK